MSTIAVNDNPYGMKSGGSVFIYGQAAISEGMGPVQTAGTGGTIAIDWSTGNLQEILLTGTGITVTFTGALPGQTCELLVKQDATGSRTITTWPTIKWAGGSAPTLTTTANKSDMIVLKYDGASFWGMGLFQNE